MGAMIGTSVSELFVAISFSLGEEGAAARSRDRGMASHMGSDSKSPSSGSSTSASTDKFLVKLGRGAIVEGNPIPRPVSAEGKEGAGDPKLKEPEPVPEKVKPNSRASSLSSALALKPVDQPSKGGLSSFADQLNPDCVEDVEGGRPKLNEPKPENGLADEATDEVSSSSSSGRAISFDGLSGKVGEDDPVSFSSARRLYSSFSFSASAPRPLGSNLSLVPCMVLEGREPVDGEDGLEGKDGELGIPSETGRDVSLRLGRDIELDRVCECRLVRAGVGGVEGGSVVREMPAGVGDPKGSGVGRVRSKLGGRDDGVDRD